MSNYLHTLMLEAVHDGGISLDRMLQLKQGTAGSAIRRRYFQWSKDAEAFVLTPTAIAVMESYENATITREGTFRPLSSFIHDASAIKLSEIRREELRQAHQVEAQRERRRQERAERKGAGKVTASRATNEKASYNKVRSIRSHVA